MKDWTKSKLLLAASAASILAILATPRAYAEGFVLSPNTSTYGILFEGAGNNTLQITNVTINGGNVGVGMTGLATDSGPSTINGSINFSAGNTGQFSNNNAADIITGGVSYNVAGVTSALTEVNSLNSTLGAEAGMGTAININGSTTINASAGFIDANGNSVFTVTGFNTTNSNILTINGDAAGNNVVLDFTGSVNFNNQVVLNGISSDQVLFNFVGGSNLTGGPTLQINDNGHNNPQNLVQGIFLDPNGPISVTNTNLDGRVFGGDTHDFQVVSGDTINVPTGAPEPGSMLLLGAGFSSMALLRKRRS